MMDHTIITIGRQFGSGGHEVGNRLAERLNIPLYDHNLIRMAARDLGISNEDAGRVDETRLGNVLSSYYIGMGDYTTFMLSPEVEKPLSDKVFDDTVSNHPQAGRTWTGNLRGTLRRLCSWGLFKCCEYIYLCL